MNKAPLKYSEARTKAMAWCAYQERSPRQLRDKLYEYGLPADEVEDLVEELEEDNFLNEQRFAESYAGGKFRIKGWGKVKIKQGLRQHKIDDNLIAKALKKIPDKEYYLRLLSILEKKNERLTEADSHQRKAKLLRFAAGRGFEQDLIWKAFAELEI
jgi:regulatory protein